MVCIRFNHVGRKAKTKQSEGATYETRRSQY
ncbi:hypothetical protein VPH234P9_0032 [Vibrio phage 234P9]